jgi:DNA mismatch endonuclease (patch repair protein)
MADVLSPVQRSAMMSAVGREDTSPELVVRRLLHSLGYRFRLHRRDLPGTPDVVLPKYRTALFVHGCFWHAHSACRFSKLPATRTDFWTQKLNANRNRDQRVQSELLALGWRVLIVWECATRSAVLQRQLADQLPAWLGGVDLIGQLGAEQVSIS